MFARHVAVHQQVCLALGLCIGCMTLSESRSNTAKLEKIGAMCLPSYLIALWHDKRNPEQRPEQDEQQDNGDPPSR